MSKQATLKLAFYESYDNGGMIGTTLLKKYKVIVVKNSTTYSPGQVLERGEVDDLCRLAMWEVTIVSLDASKGGA